MDCSLEDNIRQAAIWLAGAERVCCLTGAGVSAESGVPTFRGPDGLWEGRRPEEVATPEAFAADPDNVWKFYLFRRKALTAVRPNPGHYALACIEELVPNFTLVTQNVDGLHRLAGSRNVLEVHGDVWLNRCTRAGAAGCPEVRGTPEDGFERIPHCARCGAMMRPGVVWFGEVLPAEVFAEASRAARSCQVMLVVGTSSVVYPAAGLADCAAYGGARVIEINPEATELSPSADLCLAGPSGQVLPAVVERLAALL